MSDKEIQLTITIVGHFIEGELNRPGRVAGLGGDVIGYTEDFPEIVEGIYVVTREEEK